MMPGNWPVDDDLRFASKSKVGVELFPNTADTSMHFWVSEMISVLSWAVRHKMPFPDALRSMLPEAKPYRKVTIWFKKEVDVGYYSCRSRFSRRLHNLISDLEEGEALSVSLNRRFGKAIPLYCVAAIAHAEESGTLTRALPLLARNRTNSTVKGTHSSGHFAGTVIGSILRATPVVAICVFLPRLFASVWNEFVGSGSALVSSPYELSHGVLLLVTHRLFFALLLTIAVLPVLCRLPRMGEHVLFRIPLLGKRCRLRILRDMARSMSVCIADGADVIAAAEWTRTATRSAWLKGRLACFIDTMRSGTSWRDAWEQMYLEMPFAQWLVLNAQARDDLAAGFDLLANWSDYSMQSLHRKLQRWIEPAVTLVTACLVAVSASYIYVNLILIRVTFVETLTM